MTSENERHRPLRRVPPLPEPDQIRPLRAKARKQLGMSDRAAGAMSTIWVHPEQILPQLDNLRQMRVPGGYLLYIEGLAWTPRLMCDFSNPRNAAEYTYPLAAGASIAGAGVFSADIKAGTAELTVRVSGRDDLEAALERSMLKTRKNNDLHPPIGEQGIIDAPFGVMAVLTFDDGSQDIAVPYVREGSSRVSWAQKVLDLTAADTLFRTPASARPMNEFVSEINTLVGKPADAISDEERARIRCATTNFILIVGFEPDEPAEGNLEEAIKVKVAQEHLNAKTDWNAEAKDSVLADDCLNAVYHGGILKDADEYRWLAGGVPHDAAVESGTAEHLDDRFAQLMWLFTTEDPEVHQVIRQPIAFVLRKERRGRVNVRRTTKMPYAIELAAREFRGAERYPDSTIERIMKVMSNGGQVSIDHAWQPSSRSLSSLVKAALADAKEGSLGAASTELAVRALYYIAVHDVLRVPRNDLGAKSDRRKVSEVLEAMATTPRGVRQLADIIKDGRRGKQPILRSDSSGEPVLSGDRKTPVTLTNHTVRYEMFPKDGPSGDLDGETDPFMDAQRRIAAALKDLEHSIADLEAVTDEDDASVVEQQGIPRVTVKKWRKIVSAADDKFNEWFETGVEYAAMASEPPQVLAEEPDYEPGDEESEAS